jgi:hypothetical protein
MERPHIAASNKSESLIDLYVELFNEEIDKLKSTMAKFSKKRSMIQIRPPTSSSESIIVDLNLNYTEVQILHTDADTQSFISFMNQELHELRCFIAAKHKKVEDRFKSIKQKPKQRKSSWMNSFIADAQVNEKELHNLRTEPQPQIQQRPVQRQPDFTAINFQPCAIRANSTSFAPFDDTDSSSILSSTVRHAPNDKRNDTFVYDINGNITDDTESYSSFATSHRSDEFGSSYRTAESSFRNRNIKSYGCGFCDKKFVLKYNMETHQRTHDKNRVKPFKCQRCEYSTDLKQSLSKHMGAHQRQDEKLAAIIHSLQCEKCDVVFKDKKSLERHILKGHSNELFQCGLCGKYMNARNYSSHIQLHLRRPHDVKK